MRWVLILILPVATCISLLHVNLSASEDRCFSITNALYNAKVYVGTPHARLFKVVTLHSALRRSSDSGTWAISRRSRFDRRPA